jgi:ribosomal 50S subunit-recycling heat shock protein
LNSIYFFNRKNDLRLDKFIKLSRLIKRRTVAKEFCDLGKVSINSKTAKPSSEVRKGDVLELDFGTTKLKISVESLDAGTGKEAAKAMYKEIS